ncbi:NUDIX hydrolase [Candidatus Parcubacteria bacterium]|nr:NUDIX hydrolase [Candidatus Parcubacteria bacterium]
MDKGLIVHTIIFNKKKQILIIKRATNNDVLANYWDVPGGTLKNGEDPCSGAIRETKEESGLDINNPNLFFYTSNIDNEKNKQFVRLIFIAEYKDGEVKVNPKEHNDYRWIDISEVDQYQLVDYLYDCFAALKSKKHNLFKF